MLNPIMNTRAESPTMPQPDNFSLQEAFKVLLECKNRGELRKAIKESIYPAFEDDFRHFVITVSETDPPPLLGCSTLSAQDQEAGRDVGQIAGHGSGPVKIAFGDCRNCGNQ